MVVYRQIAHILRIHSKDGTERISQRPREGSRDAGWKQFLDSDEAPTLVTISENDRVDVEALKKSGAIIEYKPPKAKPAKAVIDEQV